MGLHLENEVARRVASDHHRSHAAILVNCALNGEMRNYCTPHIIKENFENFLIHRCNYILLSQVYCVWQVVKTPTIIFNNPLHCVGRKWNCMKLLCMKTYIRLWKYFFHFFLEWEMFGTKVVEKIKTHILSSLLFYSENYAVYEIMLKKIQNFLLRFHYNNGYAKAPLCCVVNELLICIIQNYTLSINCRMRFVLNNVK